MPPQNAVPVDLKSLLSKWKLECILSHLIAEKIDTNVLEMMKLSHIKLLLQNFPLGIQIRFEYHLEQWREEIGKPFQIYSNADRSLLKTKEIGFKTKIIAKDVESKATQTDLIIYNISGIPQASDNSTKDATSTAVPEADNRMNLEFLPAQLTPSLPTAIKPVPPKPEVDLLKILKNASCGLALINSYGLRQTFTNSERKLLIEAIVDYYITNNMDFDVQISYSLEQALLKMFPSEKLSSYRTAKCGKIFIAYIKTKAKAKAKAKAKVEVKAEIKPEIKLESKVVKLGNTIYEITNNMVVDDDFEDLCHLSDNPIMIQTNTISESATNNHLHSEAVRDNNESMVFTLDPSDDEENKTVSQINASGLSLTSTLDTATLIQKMYSQKRQRIEEIDRPFIDFVIPWDKIPQDMISSLQSGTTLGKRLNNFANLIVDELRKISTHVPMRVLRAVSQQAVMKYPYSFLDKDCDGNLKPSTTTALLTRMRNRHTFLNRQDR